MLVVGGWLAIHTPCALADNPLIMDQFTADPTARVFEGKMYLYPSHDILAGPNRGREGWFCMEDYHAFSSDDLIDWQDHGVIVSQTDVPWVDPTTYSMWAPDCVFRDGKYYFYFPARGEEKGFSIGVAISDTPEGPFTPEPEPIPGVRGIDPCVLIDHDGSAYLFYSARQIYVAKLKDNMLEIDSEPLLIDTLPQVGLIEGPFVFERNGIYYLTYPHVQNEIERLEYAISEHPMGPYRHMGVLMDESPNHCWTVHHSIVEYQGEWMLFYHEKDLSPDFDKCRSARADYLHFNNDGSIRKVIPTLRGVGKCKATSRIQIDRYSEVSENGAKVDFLNKANPHEGWKIVLASPQSWVSYDHVEFSNSDLKGVSLRTKAPKGGTIEIRLDDVTGPLIASIAIPKSPDWTTTSAPMILQPQGMRNLVIALLEGRNASIDWVQFR